MYMSRIIIVYYTDIHKYITHTHSHTVCTFPQTLSTNDTEGGGEYSSCIGYSRPGTWITGDELK